MCFSSRSAVVGATSLRVAPGVEKGSGWAAGVGVEEKLGL